MKTRDFAQKVREMREAQKRFYRLARDSPERAHVLSLAKRHEKEVDEALNKLLGSPDGQHRLF